MMDTRIDTANGHRVAARETEDWREEAMDRALEASIHYDEGHHALLREIRRHRPGASVLILYPEREQFAAFLAACAPGFRSLLSGDYGIRYGTDAGARPYLGWYGLEWEGAPIEVALMPSTNGGQAICLGPDGAALSRFAERLNDYTMRPQGRCLRYSEGWASAPDLDAEVGKVTWDDIVLPPDTLTQVREAVEGFFGNRAAFAAFGFPWKRGILLIGPPGTGKTMVCKAAAAATGLPFLYVRDLRERGQVEAVRMIFERARRLAPCVLAFEDMDGFVTEGNRSVFLNEMDGFQDNDGLLVIASSNHPGKIDDALLKRPSRFDRVFHIGLPGPEERREYCRRLLGRSTLAERITPALDIESLARRMAEKSDGFTPAYLKEAFVSAALQRAQDGADRLDDRFADAVLGQVDELRAHLKRLKDPEALADMSSGSDTMSLRR